jgi:transposase InsO family protein
VADLLSEVCLSRRSCVYHRARRLITDTYINARPAKTDIFERNYRCYSYRRTHASQTDQSVNISEKVVRRLMKPECLVAATSKRRRYGSYMRASGPAPDNVVNRDVSASVPNATWRTDITEFQTPAGKVYLSPTIDCFDGRVVSWSIDTRPNDAGCRHRQVHRQRRSALGELRSWWPPSVARQTVPNRWGQTGALDIPQGVLVRRRRMRGFLRLPEDRDVRLTRLLSTSIEAFVDAVDAHNRWHNHAQIKVSLGFRSPVEHRRSLGIAV